jgi:RNA polymerase sigma-70 factor (ECF subfamily)
LGPTASDEQLMLGFQAGDARAFSALVARHRQPVFNFILRYVGQRQRAEDLVQETWLKVVRGSTDYEPRARFTTWVYTIARNLCVDSGRKESHRQAESLDSPRGVDGEGAPLGERLADGLAPSPERAAHNLGLQPVLTAALQALPAEQREVFLLREYQGLSFKEVAEVTRVNENTVKSRMRYALEGLRARLLDAGVDAAGLADERSVASAP